MQSSKCSFKTCLDEQSTDITLIVVCLMCKYGNIQLWVYAFSALLMWAITLLLHHIAHCFGSRPLWHTHPFILLPVWVGFITLWDTVYQLVCRGEIRMYQKCDWKLWFTNVTNHTHKKLFVELCSFTNLNISMLDFASSSMLFQTQKDPCAVPPPL